MIWFRHSLLTAESPQGWNGADPVGLGKHSTKTPRPRILQSKWKKKVKRNTRTQRTKSTASVRAAASPAIVNLQQRAGRSTEQERSTSSQRFQGAFGKQGQAAPTAHTELGNAAVTHHHSKHQIWKFPLDANTQTLRKNAPEQSICQETDSRSKCWATSSGGAAQLLEKIPS